MWIHQYYQLDNLIKQIKKQKPTEQQFNQIQDLLIFDCRPLSTDWLTIGEQKDFIRADYIDRVFEKDNNATLQSLIQAARDQTLIYHRKGLTFKLIGLNQK